VLEKAMIGARDLGHDYVGTEHLLLGLAQDSGWSVRCSPTRVPMSRRCDARPWPCDTSGLARRDPGAGSMFARRGA
jgi:hypothetical protein